MIERVHAFIKKYVGFAEKAKKLGYVKQLERVVKLYNDRPHSITKVPPNELAKTNLDPKTLKEVKERIVKSSDKLTLQERKFPELKVGDFVRLAIIRESKLQKLLENWSGETYVVEQVRKTTPPTYRIEGKSFIYQRDYLLLIPRESELKRRENAKTKSDKEKKEEEEKIKKQEETRQSQQRAKEMQISDKKRYTYDVKQWNNFFRDNDVRFNMKEKRFKIHGAFIDDKAKKNVIKITYHDEKEKRLKRTDAMLNRALTRQFLDELGLIKYSIQQPEKATETYFVEKFVSSSKVGGKLFYEVKWKNFSSRNNTTEPQSELRKELGEKDFNEFVREYQERKK